MTRMPTVHFVTHPEVSIDPTVPVPEWGLSAVGLARARLLAGLPWVAAVRLVASSAERKAIETARALALGCGGVPTVDPALGENDRSATGYLPRAEFEEVADAFFAHPEQSVRGWERAVDAQRRIVGAVEGLLRTASGDGDIAVCSHGAVGALLLCHLLGVPISRTLDQPGSGGNVFTFDARTRRVLTRWRPLEDTGG